jgi:hypothetical protein
VTDASERSWGIITRRDLARLSKIAADDRAERFAEHPRWRPYEKRILSVALCQGAALHYVDKREGVTDFDVYTFYAEHPVGPFPPRWPRSADFGPSRFGRLPEEGPAYRGRRVDIRPKRSLT